ncbi:hypothetical protein NBRC116188_17380 [Oceaniserpentilla sp. 4NH20-0058]
MASVVVVHSTSDLEIAHTLRHLYRSHACRIPLSPLLKSNNTGKEQKPNNIAYIEDTHADCAYYYLDEKADALALSIEGSSWLESLLLNVR